MFHLWPVGTSLNWNLSLLGTIPLFFTAYFTNKGTGCQFYPKVLSSVLSIQHNERCEGHFHTEREPKAVGNSAGIAMAIRTLHFLRVLCSLPQTLQCLFCLASVNWLKQKRTSCIKTQWFLYNCNTMSHFRCIIYAQYYFLKARHVHIQRHIYSYAFKHKVFYSSSCIPPYTAWNIP